MSEWTALTTPERIDLTTDVIAYLYAGEGHLIAKMGMQDGVIRDMYYDEEVLLTTEELCAIPPVADLLEACEIVAGRTAEVYEIMCREGFVIEDLDDRWQKFAFTLYTMLATDAGHAERAIAKARGKQ